MSRTLVDKIQNLISNRQSRGSITFENRGKSTQKLTNSEYMQDQMVAESNRVLMPSSQLLQTPNEKVTYSQNDPYQIRTISESVSNEKPQEKTMIIDSSLRTLRNKYKSDKF